MKKKYAFYICLIIIYLLYLSKDTIFKAFDNNNLTSFMCNTKEMHYEREYLDLSSMLNLKVPDYNMIYSQVIFRNLYKFYDKITISKGTNDNIKEGSIVLSDKGLIGVVNKSYQNYSEVNLLTSSSINLSVRINESYGMLASKNEQIFVKNIKLNKEIKEGDLIYTSGLTSTPKDILIGRVKNISKDNLELEYILEVESFADLNNINYVGVIP